MQNDLQFYEKRLKEIYSVCAVPIGIISQNSDYRCFFPVTQNNIMLSYHFKEVFEAVKGIPLHTPYIFSISAYALAGLIRLNEDLVVTLGPAAYPEAKPTDFIAFMNKNYTKAFADIQLNLISGAPRIDAHYLSNICIHTANILCDTDITASDIIYSEKVSQAPFKAMESFLSADKNDLGRLSFSSDLYALIQSGNAPQLRKRLSKMSRTSYYYFQENSVFVLLYAFVFYSSIACHHASLGGLDDTSNRMILLKYLRQLDPTKGPEHFWDLLPKFMISLTKAVQDAKDDETTSDVIAKSISYIRKNLYSSISIADLEKAANASSKTITRHFQKYLDTTPAQYISDAKLEEVTVLLKNTDLAISGIANLLSYSSQTHLNRNFAKKYDCTPLQYRKAFKTPV